MTIRIINPVCLENIRNRVSANMKKNVLIIGAGGVANVVAHKCARNNDILGDICIASRTLKKCDDIIESIHRKGNLKQAAGRLYSRKLDAMDVAAVEIGRASCRERV